MWKSSIISWNILNDILGHKNHSNQSIIRFGLLMQISLADYSDYLHELQIRCTLWSIPASIFIRVIFEFRVIIL